jgi:hypothetical protein
VVEWLKVKALSSNSNTAKKKPIALFHGINKRFHISNPTLKIIVLNMKKCSPSLDIKEMQIKTTLRGDSKMATIERKQKACFLK